VLAVAATAVIVVFREECWNVSLSMGAGSSQDEKFCRADSILLVDIQLAA